jgi:hypothetical protein
MNTPDTLAALDDSFSIEQLEARFEMVAVPPPGGDMLHTSWSCKFEFQS